MKYAHPDVLDQGPNYIKNNANKMLLVTGYAFGDSYATVNGKKIAEVAMTSGDYTLGNSGNNRALTTTAKNGVATTASSQQYDQGTATSGSATTLNDTSKAWTTNAHAGRAVNITGGTGAGQTATVVSNTATALTFAAASFSPAPDATSTYKILDDLHAVHVDTVNSKVLWVNDESTNQVITSPNTVNFPAHTYTAAQPT